MLQASPRNSIEVLIEGADDYSGNDRARPMALSLTSWKLLFKNRVQAKPV